MVLRPCDYTLCPSFTASVFLTLHAGTNAAWLNTTCCYSVWLAQALCCGDSAVLRWRHADEEEQLMSLDASGKPVPAAKTGHAKGKSGSSNSPSVPSQKHQSGASGNKSTAASQKAGLSNTPRDRPAPIQIPSGISSLPVTAQQVDNRTETIAQQQHAVPCLEPDKCSCGGNRRTLQQIPQAPARRRMNTNVGTWVSDQVWHGPVQLWFQMQVRTKQIAPLQPDNLPVLLLPPPPLPPQHNKLH